jgi:hypothetical protein
MAALSPAAGDRSRQSEGRGSPEAGSSVTDMDYVKGVLFRIRQMSEGE